MTTEDAIKILDNCCIKADCARDETLPAEAEKERDDYIEACTMAIEALEKEVPKKPKRYREDFHAPFYCPACSSLLYFGAYERRCCECGQKIDWGEER